MVTGEVGSSYVCCAERNKQDHRCRAGMEGKCWKCEGRAGDRPLGQVEEGMC